MKGASLKSDSFEITQAFSLIEFLFNNLCSVTFKSATSNAKGTHDPGASNFVHSL